MMRQNKKGFVEVKKARELTGLLLKQVFQAGKKLGLESFGGRVIAWLPATRKSNPLSKLLRPVFEHKHLRQVFGANLAGATLLVGIVGPQAQAAQENTEPEKAVVVEEAVALTTESRFQAPVTSLGISQGFHRFHQGVDIRADLGEKIKPIAPGRVVEIVNGQFGYGRRVVVDHGNKVASLYAHLGKIRVLEGEEVGYETVIGEVGLTGWTTGPHLHLEIHEEGKAINPALVMKLK